MWDKIFSYLCEGINLYGEWGGGGGGLNYMGEEYLLLHLHYVNSLERANTQKSEEALLRISSGNVIISADVTLALIANSLKFTKKVQ